MQFAIAGAASVRPFNAIKDIEFARCNVLTSSDFRQPDLKTQLQRLFDRLVAFLSQPGQP
jgi:hypothetical protein